MCVIVDYWKDFFVYLFPSKDWSRVWNLFWLMLQSLDHLLSDLAKFEMPGIVPMQDQYRIHSYVI